MGAIPHENMGYYNIFYKAQEWHSSTCSTPEAVAIYRLFGF